MAHHLAGDPPARDANGTTAQQQSQRELRTRTGYGSRGAEQMIRRCLLATALTTAAMFGGAVPAGQAGQPIYQCVNPDTGQLVSPLSPKSAAPFKRAGWNCSR